MKNLKALKNRILRTVSMLCVLVTLFCAGTVSAQADELTGYSMDNLLDSIYYSYYRDGVHSSNSDLPSFWVNVNENASIVWSPSVSYRGDFFVFNIATWSIPSSLTFNGEACTLIGSQYLSESNRYVSQWYLRSSVSISNADLTAYWNSSYSGSFYILSAYAYTDFSDSIRTFDARLQAAQITAQGDLYLEDVGSENNVSTPYVYSYEGNFVSVTFSYGYLSLYIRPDDRVYDFGDSISLLMTSVGSTSFGAYLVEGDYDTFVTDLPLVSKEVSSSYGGVLMNEDMEWKLNQYLVEVDLSGHDLRGKTIVFDCHIEPMYSDDFSGDREILYGSILGITMQPDISEEPEIINFFRRFLDYWLSIVDQQTEQLNSTLINVRDSLWNMVLGVYDRTVDIINIVNSFASNVGGYFSSLQDHLTSLFNPDPDAGEDFKEDSQNNAAILGGLNDQMNSVAKPDLSGSGNISGIITPSQMSSYTTVLATVVNSPYIGQVVMLSLILSLAGYVLFGKR